MARVEISKKYVVYELNKVMNSSEHLCLERVVFKGMKSNFFDTEEEAIQALVDDEKSYTDFVILRQVFIRNF